MNWTFGRQRRGGIALVAAAMLVSACATVRPEKEPEPPSMISYFTCSTGEKITVVYVEDRATLYDPAGGRVALRQATVASGTLYKGGGHALREKTTDLIWTAPGRKARTCKSKISVPAATNP